MLSWKAIIVLFAVLQIYLIIGMIAFHFLEMDNEEVVRRDTRDYKEAILSNFTCLSEENLEALIDIITYAVNNGIDPSKNATSPSNWAYHSAFFFSGTVITTIGYGNISPSTRAGQSFCIFYALIGIPICGILLSALGDRFIKFKDDLLEKVYQKIEKRWQRKGISLFLIFGVGMFFFIIIPAIIFQAVEGWNYHEAWYYCFITLTTVGFGDFVAGINPNIKYPATYKVMVLYWIILGLVYLAIIIQDISEAFSSSVEKIEEKAENVHLNGNEDGIVEGCEAEESDVSAEIADEKRLNADNKENGTDETDEHRKKSVTIVTDEP